MGSALVKSRSRAARSTPCSATPFTLARSATKTRDPGQHQPIVDRSVWDQTQELLLAQTVRADGKPSGSMSSPVIGKLFDEQGERLTPSHAVKGNRRYRYYVSRSLMRGSAHKSGQGWRVPALEIERNLSAAVARILDERTAIVADVDKAGLGAHDITSILAAAAEWKYSPSLRG
jgi:hypothetical protein